MVWPHRAQFADWSSIDRKQPVQYTCPQLVVAVSLASERLSEHAFTQHRAVAI